MSTAPRYTPHYTVADYQNWEGDWELWKGVAVSMSPSPFGRHSVVSSRLIQRFSNALDSQACHAVVLNEIDWIVSNDTVIRPDVIVLFGGVPERHVETTPAIVVEIVSEATRNRDLRYKRDLYREQQVCNYVIVDPESETIEVDLLRNSGEFESIAVTDSIELLLCDECRIELRYEDIFRDHRTNPPS